MANGPPHPEDATTRFERFWEERGEVLLGALCRMLRDPEVAADVLQDTALDLWRLLEQCRDGKVSSIHAYVYGIARYKARDILAKQRREAAARKAHAEIAPPAATDEPPDSAECSEQMQRIRDAVKALPEGQRALFVMRHVTRLTNEEIASVLGTTSEVAKCRVYRVMKRLRKALRSSKGGVL